MNMQKLESFSCVAYSSVLYELREQTKFYPRPNAFLLLKEIYARTCESQVVAK